METIQLASWLQLSYRLVPAIRESKCGTGDSDFRVQQHAQLTNVVNRLHCAMCGAAS